MRLNRRDGNEARIVQFWRALGCLWIPMTRQAGFDGLLVARNGTHIVEIKTDAGRWALTPAERSRKAQVEAVGGVYHIVQTDDDARRLIGL